DRRGVVSRQGAPGDRLAARRGASGAGARRRRLHRPGHPGAGAGARNLDLAARRSRHAGQAHQPGEQAPAPGGDRPASQTGRAARRAHARLRRGGPCRGQRRRPDQGRGRAHSRGAGGPCRERRAVTRDQRIAVDLGARSYDVVVGAGLLARAGAEMAPLLRRPDVVVVTDAHLAATPHPSTLERSLEAAGVACRSIVVPPGEASKSMAQLGDLLDRLFELGIDRATTIVALGGGVLGDLAGFAAAVALRGLDYVQVPTTLLAQVDSAIGGKTGINSKYGKNLIGAFHQPRLVLADVGVLRTLPPRELRAGYAEVVKYGLIDRPEFFAWLEAHGREVLAGDPAAQQHAVVESCRAKAAVVAADEREGGVRALLNLGHT